MTNTSSTGETTSLSSSTTGTKSKPVKPQLSYKEMTDEIYNKHFSQYGYFTVPDIARLIQLEYPNMQNIELDRVRDGIRRYLSKTTDMYESVDSATVPANIAELLKQTKKSTSWWKRKVTSNIPTTTAMNVDDA